MQPLRRLPDVGGSPRATTARAAAVPELVRSALAATDQCAAFERDAIRAALVADLRSPLLASGAPARSDTPDLTDHRCEGDAMGAWRELAGAGR